MVDGQRQVAHPLGEVAVVLLGEDRRRREDQHLLAVGRRLDRGAQRHLGLAEADVAADQPVHRPLRLHVGLDRVDRVELVDGLLVRELGLELLDQLAVRREPVTTTGAPLGVEVDQLARHLVRGLARAGLDRLPALAAELRQRRMPRSAGHVAGDLGQLVDGDEDLVVAVVLELEVVARDAADGLGVEAVEARDPVVLVDHVVAGPQVGEAAQRVPAPAAPPRLVVGVGLAPPHQTVVRQHRQLHARGDEAVTQVRDHEPGSLAVEVAVADPLRPDPRQVVRRAVAVALTPPGDDGPVAGPQQLLELGLRRGQVAGRQVARLRVQLQVLVLQQAGDPQLGAVAQLLQDDVGLDVEVAGVLVVERGGDVLPLVVQRRGDLLVGDQHDDRVVGHQVEEATEAVDRQQVGDVEVLVAAGGLLALGPAQRRGDLRRLAVLGGQLRRRRDLDPLELAERTLGEDRERTDRLDLDVEQVDADRVVLGRREDVEDPAADRELPAVADLVDALVAAADQVLGAVVEVEQLADLQQEPVGTQLRVGHRLRQCDRRGDDDRGLLVRTVALGVGEQRVERRHAHADEVRRRVELRLVGDPARRVEADRSRVQPRAQVAGQLAGGLVVRRDHQRRTAESDRAVDPVERPGDHERAHRRGDEHPPTFPGDPRPGGFVGEVAEERAQRGRHTDGPSRGRPTILRARRRWSAGRGPDAVLRRMREDERHAEDRKRGGR